MPIIEFFPAFLRIDFKADCFDSINLKYKNMETKEIKETSLWGYLTGIIFGGAACYGIFEGGMLLIMWIGDMMLPWNLPAVLLLSVLTIAVIFSAVVAGFGIYNYFKKP